MKRLVLLSTIALTACATPSFYKDGASPSDFEQDKAECAQEASNINAGMGLGFNPIFIVQYSQDCLKRKGWTKQ